MRNRCSQLPKRSRGEGTEAGLSHYTPPDLGPLSAYQVGRYVCTDSGTRPPRYRQFEAVNVGENK